MNFFADSTYMLVETIGWIGSVLIVGAFAAISMNKVQGNSLPYQLANIAGGICFVINTVYHKAYPSAFVNVVWIVIAAVALLRRGK